MSWEDDNILRATEIASERLRNYRQENGSIRNEWRAGQMVTGVLGEIKFEQLTGIPMDDAYHLGGDPGWDFTTLAGTIDVKTFLKAYNLPVIVGKVRADIYVLAHLRLGDVAMIGWEYADAMKAIKPGYLPAGRAESHIKPAADLRRMTDLYAIML